MSVKNSRRMSWDFRLISAGLFCGALWGILEATVGHVLHWLKIPGLAGFVMFPVGFYFMIRSYLISGTPVAVALTSMTAAAIKMVDVLVPPNDVYAVINPVLAILSQSAVVVLFAAAHARRLQTGSPLQVFLGLSLSWRLVFLSLTAGLGAVLPAASSIQLGWGNAARFLILDSLVNGLLISQIFHRKEPLSREIGFVRSKTHAVSTSLIFACAVLTEFML